MPTFQQLKDLGRAIRSAREAKDLTLEELEELSGVKKNYIWIIEETYVAANRSPTLPSDEKIAALANALDIPAFELHAILGRCEQNDAAGALIREQLAKYDTEGKLAAGEVDRLCIEVAEYARWQVNRVMREKQAA